MPNTVQCRCGCGAAGTLSISGDSFATRPCRQRFYRHTVRAALHGDAGAVQIIAQRGWNINANIGGRSSISATPRARVRRQSIRIRESVQRFGVEIEFTGAPQRVVTAARELGLQIEVESYNHSTRTHWKIVQDGSCGYELVSPPLSGEEGFEEIRKACQALRSAGALVSVRCGLHVHLEANALSVDEIKRVVASYAANQARINQILARSRHTSTFATPWNSAELSSIEPCRTVQEISQRVTGRYKAVNLQSFTRYGTIEFRQHQGTHNAEKITRWISFCIALLESARANALRPEATLGGLMSALRLSGDDQAFFTERAMELA